VQVRDETEALALPGINSVMRIEKDDHIGSVIIDVDGQAVDTRVINSWKKQLDEVSLIEYLEV